MRNKTKVAFLSLILSAALIAVACGKSQSSQEPSSQSSLDTSSISSSESSSESTSSSQQSSSQQSSSQEASSSEEVTSSSEESSSSAADVYFTVTFKVDGAVVQTKKANLLHIVAKNQQKHQMQTLQNTVLLVGTEI